MLDKNLIANTQPKARAEQVVLVNNARITVLAPELIRVEVADSREFLDEATQIVWYRDLGESAYTVKVTAKRILVETASALFSYNIKKRKVDFVTLDGAKHRCNNRTNLKGTTRTLDMTMGAVPLKNGIIGKNGIAVMEDKSLILKADGQLYNRVTGTDTYIFASSNYRNSLKAFFGITGRPPMLPRYALGNWWSRYHAYSDKEYLELMQKFIQEDVPLSVATVDMDWHWVDIKKQFGSEFSKEKGWTGYSWNTDLFPDYKSFLKQVKDKNLKISLNLHPAKGVRAYEDAYPQMCHALDADPKTRATIPFNMLSDKFINAYFNVLHKPYESDGVDIWWIDWQQGSKTTMAGYDPLWGLNHYHYLHSAADNKRPLILSRYAGLGSHRYPIGFSGDTIILWSALRYQPYFTANAANCGYFTWSHDIGGHHLGRHKSQELYLRWLQFGVFTPILRLHSNNLVLGKEPWLRKDVCEYAKQSLRFRHRLIPYIYSAYYRAYNEGRAISEPLYYSYPKKAEAYKARQEYYFGSELLVAPITTPSNKIVNKSAVWVWLPDGRYTDIFTGRTYQGGRVRRMVRGYDSIPVLARAGAIVPLSNNIGNDTSNPASLDVLVYSGNRSFTLYEDDGISQDYTGGNNVKTVFSVEKDDDKVTFTIAKPVGNLALIPQERSYKICFNDITAINSCIIQRNGVIIELPINQTEVMLPSVSNADEIIITLTGVKYK